MGSTIADPGPPAAPASLGWGSFTCLLHKSSKEDRALARSRLGPGQVPGKCVPRACRVQHAVRLCWDLWPLVAADVLGAAGRVFRADTDSLVWLFISDSIALVPLTLSSTNHSSTLQHYLSGLLYSLCSPIPVPVFRP